MRINLWRMNACPSRYIPSTREIVERLVAEERTTGITGQLRKTGDGGNAMEQFPRCRLRADGDLVSVSLSDVTLLDGPGDLFAGFTEEVLDPWKRFLLDNGFTWDRCYALARVSGPNTCTGYHMDRSNVLFWNVRGRKAFHGFSDPDRWVPLESATMSRKEQVMPEGLSEGDVLSYEVGDDVLLWNHLLTPHWVDAPELTFGINLRRSAANGACAATSSI